MGIVEGITRSRRVSYHLAKPWVAVDGGHRQQVDAARVIVVEGGATQHGRLQRTGKGFVLSILFLTHRQSRLKKGKRLKTRDTKEEKEGLRQGEANATAHAEGPHLKSSRAPPKGQGLGRKAGRRQRAKDWAGRQGIAKEPRTGPEGRAPPKSQGLGRKAGHRQRAKDWARRQGAAKGPRAGPEGRGDWARRQGGVFLR